MKKRDQNQELRDRYRYPGLHPSRTVPVAAWDEGARIIRLTRRSKKRNAADVGLFGMAGTIAAADGYETCRVVTHAFYWSWKSAE